MRHPDSMKANRLYSNKNTERRVASFFIPGRMKLSVRLISGSELTPNSSTIYCIYSRIRCTFFTKKLSQKIRCDLYTGHKYKHQASC